MACTGRHDQQALSILQEDHCCLLMLTQTRADRRTHLTLVHCSVEPTSSSHVFLVYGEACFKDEFHPNCTHTDPGTRPLGKLFSLDLQRLMGNEWQVCLPNHVVSIL